MNRRLVGTMTCIVLAGVGYHWIAHPTSIPHLVDNIVAAYLILWGLYAVWSQIPRGELGKRFLLMTTTLACIVILLEAPAWVGLLDYRAIFSISGGFDTWDKPGFVAADELLWLHQPHSRIQGHYTRGDIGKALCFPQNESRAYDWRFDRNGFRNDSDLESADIAVVGDSFIEAAMLPSSALLTAVLGGLENRAVANLGIAGYGPQQELGALKRHALELRPKTVVWSFYEGNDLDDAKDYDRKASRFPKEQSVLSKGSQRSFVANALRAFLRTSKGCIPSPDLEKRFGTVRDRHGSEHRVYFPYPINPLSNADIEALETVRRVLTEAYRLCRERGIRLVVVFGPTEYRIYHGLPNLVGVSEEVRTWVINDLPDRLRALVAGISSEIEYVDLTPHFRREAERDVRVFLPDDTHWSSDGHRIVAETIHKMLSGQIAVAK